MTRLVLAGAGHSHAKVLLEFARRPVEGLEIVLVSPGSLAPYSGMVPGWLAGHYQWEACCIDFGHLCRMAKARWLAASVVGCDTQQQTLRLDSGEQLGWDFLSLDIGSTLRPAGSASTRLLPMRPLSMLKTRWDRLLQQLRDWPSGKPCQVLMVGGGAAGVESLLAVWQSMRKAAPAVDFRFALATQGELVPGLAPGAARRLRAHLAARNIDLHSDFLAAEVVEHGVADHEGKHLQADVVLWATGAAAHAWPAESGLPVDAKGFVRIDRCLRAVGHPRIFASGDCAGWEPPLPKAGVFAVRMGPVLAHNLRASILGQALRSYRPQRRFLVLIGTGDAHAVAARGGWALEGGWVWRWKEFIDRRFVDGYNRGRAGPAA